MGFFDRIFGTGLSSPEPWKKWDDLTMEDRIPAGEALFNRVLADCPFVTDAIIRARPEDHSIDLEGNARGIAFRVRLGAGGRLEIKLKYPRIDMPYLDLEYDSAAVKTDADDKPFEADERRCFVAPHIFFEGSDAAEELAIYEKLPAEMRARIIAAIELGRTRYFRSRYEDLEADCGPDIQEIPSPQRYLVAMIDVASELTVHRIAETTAAVAAVRVDGEKLFAHVSKIEPREKRFDVLETLLAALAKEPRFCLPSTTKVFARRNDEKIDLRWVDQGVPVRVVADLGFDDLEINARAEGIECELEIERDDDIDHEDEAPEDDEWSGTGTRRVFLAKNIYIEGSETSTREQISLLRALPKDLHADLLQAMSDGDFKWLTIAEGSLHTVLLDLSKAELDHMEKAFSIARLFARLIVAIPKGRPTAITDKELRCRFCHARWFDSPTCTNCGAPP